MSRCDLDLAFDFAVVEILVGGCRCASSWCDLDLALML